MEGFDVRVLESGALGDAAELEMSAYPTFYKDTDEVKEKLIERLENACSDDETRVLGIYDGETLVGLGIEYDLELNLHGRMVPALGLGSLAVDLKRKKEGIARSLIQHMMDAAQAKGINSMLLYPFNHRFYRNFGFGAGTPYHQYYVNPLHFKKTGLKCLVRSFDSADEEKILSLYDQLARGRNGMIRNPGMMKKQLFAEPKGRRLVIEEDGVVIGYATYSQEAKDSRYLRDQSFIVREQLHATPRSRLALVDFLASQADQTERVVIGDFSADFYHLLEDVEFAGDHRMMPMISHMIAREGLGICYRILDVQRSLDAVENYNGPALSFTVDLPREEAPVTARISGYLPEVAVRMGIAEFSRFYHGAVRLEALFAYGALQTQTPDRLREIDRILDFRKPLCLTRF